jgi:hypothetical protein
VSKKTGTLPVYIVTPIVNEVCYTIPKAGTPGKPCPRLAAVGDIGPKVIKLRPETCLIIIGPKVIKLGLETILTIMGQNV